MREIKFRAWDGEIMSSNTATIQEIYNKESIRDGNALTWLQCIGLKDKNGREIYEGDVNQDGGVMVWNQDSCSFCWDYPKIELMAIDGTGAAWCEIIGNIYENPELIK